MLNGCELNPFGSAPVPKEFASSRAEFYKSFGTPFEIEMMPIYRPS